MPQYGQSPWEETGTAMSGMGNSVANLSMARQIGQYRAQQFMQQQAYHNAMLQLAQQKAMQEGQVQQAQISNYGAEQGLNEAKMGEVQSGQSMADLVGRLTAARGAVNNPSLQNNPEVLNNAVMAMRQAGVLPQGQVAMSREDFNGALSPAIIAALSRQGATSPAAAVNMLQGQNVPRGDINYNTVTGDQQYGMPPEAKLHEVAPGGTLVDNSGNTMFASPNKPSSSLSMEDRIRLEAVKQILAAKGRAVAPGSDAPDIGGMSDYARSAGANVPSASTNTPTATRNVGDQVTTAKGTFKWNGQGWEPVTQ